MYSEYLEKEIPSGYTKTFVYFSKDGSEPYEIGKSYHYTWNEDDLLYYRDDTDELFNESVPRNGYRGLSLRLNKKVRVMIKAD